MTVSITYLNHSSVLIETERTKLLTDPWFFGTLLYRAWELRFENPNAIRTAARATHIWISHTHPDFLHLPSLEEICKQNPEAIVLLPEQATPELHNALNKMGFTKRQALCDRKPTEIKDITFFHLTLPVAGFPGNFQGIFSSDGGRRYCKIRYLSGFS